MHTLSRALSGVSSVVLSSICLLVLNVFFVSLALAAFDAHDFSSHPEKEVRYQKIIDEVRCPKCQNQNISGSDAPISKDLRTKVYDLLIQGKSDAEIYAYLVERYGDFVLYRPPVRKNTWVLWFGPPVLLISVLIILMCLHRARLKQVANSKSDMIDLDVYERERLEKIKANHP